MSLSIGDRVRCTASGQTYTVHAEPNGADVLVRSDLAGGIYWVAVDGLENVPRCRKCGGSGQYMKPVGFSQEVRGPVVRAMPCPECQPEPIP